MRRLQFGLKTIFLVTTAIVLYLAILSFAGPEVGLLIIALNGAIATSLIAISGLVVQSVSLVFRQNDRARVLRKTASALFVISGWLLGISLVSSVAYWSQTGKAVPFVEYLREIAGLPPSSIATEDTSKPRQDFLKIWQSRERHSVFLRNGKAKDPSRPSTEDRLVLEAVLIDLIGYGDFNPLRSGNKSKMVLVLKTPGFRSVSAEEIGRDVGQKYLITASSAHLEQA